MEAEEATIIEMPYTPELAEDLIKYYADKYAVDFDLMYDIVDCETAGTFKADIQSGHVKNGVQEPSFGLSQIHLPSHKTVSYEQAIDPNFALNFLAENISQGNVGIWSCYKIVR